MGIVDNVKIFSIEDLSEELDFPLDDKVLFRFIFDTKNKSIKTCENLFLPKKMFPSSPVTCMDMKVRKKRRFGKNSNKKIFKIKECKVYFDPK